MTDVTNYNRKASICLAISLLFVITSLSLCAGLVYEVDPFFHYHAPYIDKYCYVLDNERSMNDGIAKHFKYNAIVTGTSMAENFKTSEVDSLFGVKSIKIPYSGGTFKEISDAIDVAMNSNNAVRLVIQSFDRTSLMRNKDALRFDLGEYPTYLYDDNGWNDYQYLFNKDILIARAYEMKKGSVETCVQSGITTFDEYGNWMNSLKDNAFGKTNLQAQYNIDMAEDGVPLQQQHLTEPDIRILEDNIVQNILGLADRYPDTQFYYFFPPYSAISWKQLIDDGRINSEIEAKCIAIELLLTRDNIKLYDFDGDLDITTNLNNYYDNRHYGEWINSLVLKRMYLGEDLLTRNNYQDYIEQELEKYWNYDYKLLYSQVDYDCDCFQGDLIYTEHGLSVVPPILLDKYMDNTHIFDFETNELKCDDKQFSMKAKMWRDCQNVYSDSDKIFEGCFLNFDATNYKHIFFDAKRIDDGEMYAIAYDSIGNTNTSDIMFEDLSWHKYCIDVSEYEGMVTFVAHSDDITNSGKNSFIYKNIEIY